MKNVIFSIILVAVLVPLQICAGETGLDYILHDTPQHGDYACTYIDIDKTKVADGLGLSLADFTASYKADNSGTVKLCTFDSFGALVSATNAGENAAVGYWLNKDGFYSTWANGGYIYFVYDPLGRIGVGQMPSTQTGKQHVNQNESCSFSVVFTCGSKQSVVSITYKADSIVIEDAVVDSLFDAGHRQLVADTLSSARPVWYNKTDFKAAFDAYAAAGNDLTKKKEVIRLMFKVDETFKTIVKVYDDMRTAVTTLYNKVKSSGFSLLDTVRELYSKTLAYYDLDEDQRNWMSAGLSKVQDLSAGYAAYVDVGVAFQSARIQLAETDYEGKADFNAAYDDARLAFAGAETISAIQAVLQSITKAQITYLSHRPSEWVTIKNGNDWTAVNDGSRVQAHGPGFLRVGDVWYMCGEDRSGPWNPDVNLYSSTDLVHWKFERKIVQNGVTDPQLGSGRFIERPKLLFNKSTGKYLVWCHYEQGNYGASEAACFECDSVNGPYKKIWSGQPCSTKSRDCNAFQDEDGTAYFISTTDENSNLGLFRLTDDYHAAAEKSVLFAHQGREAPAIVKVGNHYFMFNSACSGWAPNQCKMSYTTNLKTGWTNLSNVGNYCAYDTQAAAILTIKGTKKTTYLYVGDRWQDPDLQHTKTIIFPISFNGTSVSLDCRERFDINFVTGEWRETPTENVFADRTDWKVKTQTSEHASYPAANVLDDNVNTFWRSNSDNDNSSTMQSVTIDMGNQLKIKGLVITPRMDYATGLIRCCMIQTSTNGVTWKTAVKTSWLPYWGEIDFAETECRYIKISKYDGGAASIAEVNAVLADEATSVAVLKSNDMELGNDMDDSVISVAYYSLDGRRLACPGKGMYLKRLTFPGGVVKTIKCITK